MSTSLRSLSGGGPSLWPPAKTAPLDGLLDLGKGDWEQLEKKVVESFCEKFHFPTMESFPHSAWIKW